jgi:hypothetical protein
MVVTQPLFHGFNRQYPICGKALLHRHILPEPCGNSREIVADIRDGIRRRHVLERIGKDAVNFLWHVDNASRIVESFVLVREESRH